MLNNALNFFMKNFEKENIKNEILDLFFPPVCGKCGKIDRNWICPKCYKYIEKFKIIQNIKISDIEKILDFKKQDYIKINKIQINFQEKFYYEEFMYLFHYKNIIRKIIIDYKFNNKPYISNFFSYIILQDEKILKKLKEYDTIIPVPMFEKKKKQRGYNQTQLIVKNIFSKLGIILDDINLIKIKNTKIQSSLSASNRKENIKEAFFIINNENIENKKIILFDDIFTTGETVNEISRILKKSGAKEILVFVLAKD